MFYFTETNSAVYSVDAKNGNLSEIRIQDRNWLCTPLRPAFCRAQTDADVGLMGIAMRKYMNKDSWTRITLDELPVEAEITQEEDGGLRVVNRYQDGDEALGILVRY